MKYTIRKKGEKYYKKFKPCGADLFTGLVIVIVLITIAFEVIRG